MFQMFSNSSDEPHDEQPGPGRGAGQNRWFWASLWIGAAVWWRNRQLTRETEDMKIQLERAQRNIRRIANVNFFVSNMDLFVLSSTTSKFTAEQKRMKLDTVSWNTIFLYSLSHVDALEDLMVERQHVFCSYFRPKSQRQQIEEKIFERCDRALVFNDEDKATLKEVLESDRSCGSCLMFLWSGDKRRNGSNMWTFLKEWRKRYKEEMHKIGHQYIIENPDPRPEFSEIED